MNNILILGSGGREHSIAWSLFRDNKELNLFCAPGNGGTSSIAKNISININQNRDVLDVIKKYNIDCTIVGPENPLNNGIVDYLEKKGYKVFGPRKFAAQLECSKIFARKFMEKYKIPQPSFFECSNEEEVISVSMKLGFPLVLKTDGLASGKGVIICKNKLELDDGLNSMFIDRKFGNASNKISVEECLFGEELSIFVVTDGVNYKILNSAQDHKRIFNSDLGPNTGGMGAYCPAPLFEDTLRKKVIMKIIEPTISGMQNEGHPFKGFLYIGIMIVDGNPYVIEYNVRLGDPESQVLLPMLKDGLLPIINSVINNSVDSIKISLKSGFAVAVVLASKGYPEAYEKDYLIEGLDKASLVFHSGTKVVADKYYTNGGRVLNVIGQDLSLHKAIKKAYENIEKISFKNMYYRTDIGKKGLDFLKKGK